MLRRRRVNCSYRRAAGRVNGTTLQGLFAARGVVWARGAARDDRSAVVRGGVMQAAVLKLKATQAVVSKLSVDVREKVAAKKKERAASKEAKNASATGAAASVTAADEGAGSSGEGIRKIHAINQAALRSARKLRASLSKKGRYPRRRTALLHTSVPARGARWGAGTRGVRAS